VTTPTFAVPEEVALLTHGHLRERGFTREEAVVLWIGTFDPPVITSAILPEQVSGVGRFRVPLRERQRISRELAGTGQIIVAQVHSHPHEAFHSEIDDREAIPRRVGSYSLVVPIFGGRPHLLDDAVLVSLHADGSWLPASLATFEIPDTFTELPAETPPEAPTNGGPSS
jgi:hypothetical protein